MTARPVIRLVSILVAVALLAGAAAAQTPFAAMGLGQNVETGSARDTGRGGWGMADSDTLTPGTLNQAALADLRFTGLIFSGYGEKTRTEGGGEARTTYRTLLPNTRLAIPLRRGLLALHAGFNVKRSMEWTSQTDFEMVHFDEDVSGTERNERTGSLYQVPVGLSWRPAGGIAVAGSYNLVRGSVEERVTQLFTDPLNNYYLTNIRVQKDEMSGKCFTASVLVDGLGPLQLGASYTTPYDLTMKRDVSISGVANRAADEFTLTMPAEYRGGVMLNLPDHWRFGADGQLALYSELDGRDDWEPYLRDEWTLSAGLERTLVRAKHGRGYAVPIRLGYQWRQWAHAVDGPPVYERTVSVGTGFPFRNRLGMIDISLSYSWIGDEADNGYQSKVWRLGLSITGLEPLIF